MKKVYKVIRFSLTVFLFIIIGISFSASQRKTRQQAPGSGLMIRQSELDYQLWEGFMLVRKANDGDAPAQHELGLRYLMGKGFPADTVKAAYWIQRAADQHFLLAQYNLALLYLNGWGMEWNPFEAYRRFKVAAEKAMPEAEYVVGLLSTEDLIVPQNWPDSYRWIKKASDGGFEPAKKILIQFDKRGIKPDTMLTQSRKHNSGKNNGAARPDSAMAQIRNQLRPVFLDFNVDTTTHVDDSTLVRDVVREASPELRKAFGINETGADNARSDSSVLANLLRAGETGSPEALAMLGRMYERGVEVRKDLIAAAMFYLRAIRLESIRAPELLWNMRGEKGFAEELEKKAKGGDPNAQFAWAGLAGLGFDRRITGEEALALLQSAVSQNHAQAMIELGICYQSGRWVPQDRMTAMSLWNRAARMGNQEAEIRLAAMSVLGKGEHENLYASVALLQRAAEDGSILAQVGLGYCYEKGIGLAQNKGEAARLYRSAAERGSQSAYLALRRMHDEIRPKEKEFEMGE